MILSHYQAGTGAICVETREEGRLLRDILAELPATAPVCTVASPGGPLRDARSGRNADGNGLAGGYQWACGGPGRVLVVYDWHVLCNAPGHWRGLIEALPSLRQPKGAGSNDLASLVVFVGPSWELGTQNPLRGLLPILPFDPPDRAGIKAVAESLATLNGEQEQVIDALCGLSADSAEQAAAEVLAATGGTWDVDRLRGARRQAIREAGLEIWPAVAELGGLAGLQSAAESEVFPWIRDGQLSVRRILCAGLPGTGKSYAARWFASRLGCECARLSIPQLKAGIVGASEGNLRRALRVLDAMGQHAPLVCVVDEIDTIARDGLDGGTSSGMFAELLTWLQESTSQVLVVATLNRLDKLDAALESRFQMRFFYDLPTIRERASVADIHYRRLGCNANPEIVVATAEHSEGFSSREIAEHVCPSVARLSGRKPTAEIVAAVCAGVTPASRTQADQLKAMRQAASTLRRANDPEQAAAKPTGRRIGGVL